MKEVVNQLYQAFSDRDIAKLERLCSKDIVWTQNPGFPGGTVSIGIKDIIKNVYDANTARWKFFSFERNSTVNAEDKVLVQGVYTVQAHGSDEKISAQTAHVFTIKDRKVISFEQYTDSKTLWDNYQLSKYN